MNKALQQKIKTNLNRDLKKQGLEFSSEQVSTIIESMFDTLTASIIEDGYAPLPGLGLIKKVYRKPRSMNVPYTRLTERREVVLPERLGLMFRPSDKIKIAINK
jgi:nucleoid DNA-binding protein